MKAWTLLREHVRADGAVVRVERSAAGRWQLAVRRGAVLVGLPRQWPPGPLHETLERAIRAAFLVACVQPLPLPPEATRALAQVREHLAWAPDEERLLGVILDEGHPTKVLHTLGLLADRQPRVALVDVVRGIERTYGAVRKAALDALPEALRAPLTLPDAEVPRVD